MMIWQNERYRLFQIKCWGYNCYLLQCGENNILIDTGLKWVRGMLRRRLRRLNIDTLAAVVLTHYHSDHAGNAAYIAREFGCPVYASPEFADWLRRGECQMPRSNSVSAWIVNRLSRGFGFIHWDCFDPIEDVWNIEELLAMGMLGDGAEVRALTAHTDDSICLVIDKSAAIVGDAFVYYPPLGNVMLPWADHPERIADSWRELLNWGCGVYCQGHGTPVSQKVLAKVVRKLG